MTLPNKNLRDGLVANVNFDNGKHRALIAPRSALIRTEGRYQVYVVERIADQLQAQVRQVKTGRQAGEAIEILDGLQVGDRVVVEGQFAFAFDQFGWACVAARTDRWVGRPPSCSDDGDTSFRHMFLIV